MTKIAVLCLLAPVFASAQTYPSSYVITEIGANYWPRSINNSNVVVGNFGNQGFIYNKTTGVITYLPGSGNSSYPITEAVAINDSGNIAGQWVANGAGSDPNGSGDPSGAGRAFRYIAATGTSTELNIVAGPSWSNDINKTDGVIGTSIGAQQAFLQKTGTNINYISAPNITSVTSRGASLNDKYIATGKAFWGEYIPDNNGDGQPEYITYERAYISSDTRYLPITLTMLDNFVQQPAAINSLNHIVGYDQSNGTTRAFYWDGTTHYMTSMPTVMGSRAYAINKKDQIVGYVAEQSTTTPGLSKEPDGACFYKNGGYVKLDTLTGVNPANYHFYRATSINDNGVITAMGWKWVTTPYPQRVYFAAVLTPVTP